MTIAVLLVVWGAGAIVSGRWLAGALVQSVRARRFRSVRHLVGGVLTAVILVVGWPLVAAAVVVDWTRHRLSGGT